MAGRGLAVRRRGARQPRPATTAPRLREAILMELDGQIAIVTGGGRGIGRATALELARMGAGIVIAELDATNARRAADEIAKLGRPSLALATDVTRPGEIDAMVRETIDRYGRIDVLVN